MSPLRVCKYCWIEFKWWPQSKVCPACMSIQKAKWWKASWSKMAEEDAVVRKKKASEMLKHTREINLSSREEKRVASRKIWHMSLTEWEKQKIINKQLNTKKQKRKKSWQIKKTIRWKHYYRNWKINFSGMYKYTRDICHILKSRICKYCWEGYYSRHMWKDFCSKQCYEKYRTEIWWIWIHKCKMCWKEFKPKRTINSTYCSVQCANRDREKNHKVLSDTNIYRWGWLKTLWYSPSYEFPLGKFSYDISIWNNILIEINPSAFHSSTYSPYWDKYIKNKMYHYNKTHYAINNGYKCINIRDWTTKDEIVKMLNTDFIYEWVPNLHWCNRKTGDHYDNKIKGRYIVWVYDSWNVKFI